MAIVKMDFLADDTGAVRAAQRVREAIDDAEKAGVKFGSTVKRSSSEVKDGLGELASSALSVGVAFAGLSGIKDMFRAIGDEMEAVRLINEKLTNASVATQRSLLAMAQQEGISTQEAARRVAETAARTGASAPLIAESRRAVHSLMGAGAIQQGRQDIIAGALAAYGGSPEQATQLTEALMRAPEVKDEESTLRALAMMQRAMKDSPYSTLGEFAGSFGRGQLTAMQQGMPLKEALAFQAQARMVTANPTQAARMMEQMYRILWTEHGRSMIEEETGKAPDSMGITAQFKALMSSVAKKNPEELQGMFDADLVPSRERQWMFNFNTPAAREAHDRIMKSLDQASPDEMRKVISAYRDSAVGQVTGMETVQQMRLGQRETWRSVADKMSEQARTALENRHAKDSWPHRWLREKLENWTPHKELELVEEEAAIELKNLGVKEEPGSYTTGTPFAGAQAKPGGLRQQLLLEKLKWGFPADSIITPGGQAVTPDNSVVPATRPAASQPVTYNLYGDHYHLGQQDVTRPGAGGPEVVYS